MLIYNTLVEYAWRICLFHYDFLTFDIAFPFQIYLNHSYIDIGIRNGLLVPHSLSLLYYLGFKSSHCLKETVNTMHNMMRLKVYAIFF